MVVHGTAVFLLVVCISVSRAEVPDRILPFTFTENGLIIEGVDFGQVPQASFHQRFIVITNTSSHPEVRHPGLYVWKAAEIVRSPLISSL